MERRGDDADAYGDAGETPPDDFELLWESRLAGQRRDDEAADIASLEERLDTGGSRARVVQPEGVETVAEMGGPLMAAF